MVKTCLTFQLEVVKIRVVVDTVASPVSVEANETTTADGGSDDRDAHAWNEDPSSLTTAAVWLLSTKPT